MFYKHYGRTDGRTDTPTNRDASHLKIASSKIVKFQGSLKLAHFLMIEIWGLPTLPNLANPEI